MILPKECVLLRVFISENDRYGRRLLYEEIVERARARGMAGATVLHGVMGFGKASRIHSAKVLRLSDNLPVVVEIVDRPERLEAFLPELTAMIDGGLVTLERVEVVLYRHSPDESSGPEGRVEPSN